VNLGGGFAIILYWIELQKLSGIAGLLFLTRLKPVLIGVVVLCTIAILPISLWKFISVLSTEADTVYNGFLVIVFFVLIVTLTVGGINLVRTLSKTDQQGGPLIFKTFLLRINRYIIALDSLLVLSIITLLAYQFMDVQYEQWPYIIYQTILRTEEFGIVGSTLLFVAKKKPANFQGASYMTKDTELPTVVASETGDEESIAI